MPCLEITMPKSDARTKQELAARITDTVTQIAGFEPEIFGIHFMEYGDGQAAQAGKLWDGMHGIPYLHFVLYCPRLRRTTKRKLVESLTHVFTETLGEPDWLPIIHICEHPYDNIGVGGEILSYADDALAARLFYYDTPED